MDHQQSRRVTRQKTHRQCKKNSIVAIRDQHPFLNSLIVQRILEFCKINNKTDQNFPKLRLVCKLWNEECTKVLRRETQIPLPRLLEPYPEGLEWAWNRFNLASDLKHYYKCPLPTIREFENFHITATCESFKDRKVHRWLSLMGKQVKSLQFTSALTCFHQNDILLNILHNWCPNLEALHLDGIQCFHSLLYMFEGNLEEFSSFRKSVIKCKGLKTLTISVVGDLHFQDCKCKVGRVPAGGYSRNKETLKKITDDFRKVTSVLPEINLSVNPEISEYIRFIIRTGSLVMFPKLLNKYPKMNGVDWGILGHILKNTRLEKLVIKDLLNTSQTADLIMSLLLHPSKLRSSLKHLEFQNASLCVYSLKALTLFDCSLFTLRFDNIVWRSQASTLIWEILRNCSETLTSFEFGAEIVIFEANNQQRQHWLHVPVLPKLKSFTNKTIGLVRLCGRNLLSHAYDLEKCCIQNLKCEGNSDTERRNISGALQWFCAHLDVCCLKKHPLKELKIQFGIESSHVALLKRGLSNLVNVEFHIIDPLDLLLAYPKSDGWEKLESVTLSIGNVAGLTDISKISNRDVSKCFGKFERLKFFDLKFQPNSKTYLPLSTFAHGFSKLPNLRSLKTTNACYLAHETSAIECSTKHIPSISFLKTRIISKEEVHLTVALKHHE